MRKFWIVRLRPTHDMYELWTGDSPPELRESRGQWVWPDDAATHKNYCTNFCRAKIHKLFPGLRLPEMGQSTQVRVNIANMIES